MQVNISTKGIFLTEELKDFIERRLLYALGRFGHRVRAVRVSVLDLNGPKGGLDKQCRLTVECAPTGLIEAEVVDDRVESALARAADRIARRVRDLLDRRRDTRRRSDGEVINPWAA